MSETFDLGDPGTSESQWSRALREHTPSELNLRAYDRLVVVAAHPDDETLGAAGLIESFSPSAQVVVLTDGASSHPRSPSWSSRRLAQARRQEVHAAVALLDPDATVTTLDLPDGRLARHLDEAVDAVVEAIGADADRTLVVSPWHADRHPDHAAAATAAAIAAHRTDAEHWGYPIWTWHWCAIDEFPWEAARSVRVTDRESKRAAVRTHLTQIEDLSPAPGDERLLDPKILAHFDRDVEILLPQAPAQDDALDRLHRERRDPWGVDERWYERRKRALTLATLGRAHYRTTLEVGCSVGALAAELSARSDRVIAVDASATAVDAAAHRTRRLGNVEVRQLDLPAQWPVGRFDLVVLSEVGYFFGPRSWHRLLGRVADSLTADGEVVLCHWLPQPRGWPLNGERVHQAAREVLATGDRRVMARHLDQHFLIELIGSADMTPLESG